jgi:hypothetical protein
VSGIIPEAYCDALLIIDQAPKALLPMSAVEMHLFSYLSCVLALFQGHAIGDWGYSYAVTSDGFPFSAELETARKVLVERSVLISDDEGMMSADPEELAAELSTVLSIGPWIERSRWIKGATECALAFPTGSIRYAISQTPGMAASTSLRQRRRLLDTDDVSLLYDEYKIVRSVLGEDIDDVLSPAVVWLSARVLRNKDTEVGL